MINQGMNSRVLRHKEDHLCPGIKVYIMVIVLIALTLDIKLYISEHMEEIFNQDILLWPHTRLSVTNSTIMVI
jgi:hypothetical protein